MTQSGTYTNGQIDGAIAELELIRRIDPKSLRDREIKP